MDTSRTNRIEEQILLRAPQERVWDALADVKNFGAWFGVDLGGHFEPGVRLRGPLTEEGVRHLIMELVVEEVEPLRLLSWRWRPTTVDPNLDPSKEASTLVALELTETARGTLLALSETGFDGIPADRREEAYRRNSEGWNVQMKRIEAFLERVG